MWDERRSWVQGRQGVFGQPPSAAAVRLETGPLTACEFSQSDVYEYSGFLGAGVVDTGNGGFEGFNAEAAG